MIRSNREPEDPQDRRSHVRVTTEASVTVRSEEGRLIRGRLVNLSAGGALVELDYNDDHAAAAQRVDLLIEADDHVTAFARFQTLRGTIRHLADPRHIGVQFERPRHEMRP